MKKKNFFIIILALSAMVMSSCGTSLGLLGEVMPLTASQIAINNSDTYGSPVGNYQSRNAGIWSNPYTKTTVMVTNKKNVYLVRHHNGKVSEEYLKGFNEIQRVLPPNCIAFTKPIPYWDNFNDVLCWYVRTTGAYRYVLFYNGGSANGYQTR